MLIFSNIKITIWFPYRLEDLVNYYINFIYMEFIIFYWNYNSSKSCFEIFILLFIYIYNIYIFLYKFHLVPRNNCEGQCVFECICIIVSLSLCMHMHQHTLAGAQPCQWRQAVFTLKSFLLSWCAYETAPDDGALVIKAWRSANKASHSFYILSFLL